MAAHPLSRDYLAYDEYVTVDVHGVRTIYQGSATPLAEYRVGNDMHVLLRATAIPGEVNVNVQYDTSSDQCKRLTRSMIRHLLAIEAHGGRLVAITADHIFVSSDDLALFKSVEIVYNEDEADQLFHLRENFQWVADIVENWFPADRVPGDLAHLFNLMRVSFQDREIFHVHTSLLPDLTFYHGYKDMYDLLEMLPWNLFEHVLLSLPLQIDTNWRLLVRSSHLLCVTYYHPSGNGYFIPPARNRYQRYLTPQQFAALTSLGCHVGHNRPQFLTAQDMFNLQAFKMLKFLRNRPAHRMGPLTDKKCSPSWHQRLQQELGLTLYRHICSWNSIPLYISTISC